MTDPLGRRGEMARSRRSDEFGGFGPLGKGSGMAWICLFAAGTCEVIWAITLKYTDGFAKFWPSVLALGAMMLSLLFLGASLRGISVSTAYTIWTGIGIVGTAVVGLAWLGEPTDWLRMSFVLLIVSGIIGLYFVTP
jgi:quaternary ammonium compound-resistance protein SugE